MPPTATLELTEIWVPSGLTFAQERANVKLTQAKDGTGVLSGLRIFKAGTFKDSMGVQRTWTTEHLQQMVFHFNLLKDRGLFPNVPVREGHPSIFGSDGTVKGYFDGLAAENDFLVADLGLTEPDAVGKWKRGTYRARSLEVGMYETNDEQSYWPVVMGVAFVDIPAVEGLYNKGTISPPPDHKVHFFSLMKDDDDNKETPVPPDNSTQTTVAFRIDGKTTSDAVAVQAHIDSLEKAVAETPKSFKVNGQEVTDWKAVQAHIDTLEETTSKAAEDERVAFVKKLGDDKKIMAPMVEKLTELAKGMTPEQFEQFKTTYEGAPALSVLSSHGTQGGGTDPAKGNGVSPDDEPDEVTLLEERVAMSRRAGMTEDQIKKTPSYVRLQELRKTA